MALEVVIDSTLDTGVTADVTIFQDLNGDGVFENADTVTATGGTETFALPGLSDDNNLSGTYESQVEYSDDNDVTTGGEVTSITVQQQTASVIVWDSEADLVEPESRLAIPTSGVGARSQDQLAHKYELGSPDKGLSLYYPFDDGTATDSALNNDGTINGPSAVGSGIVGTDSMSFNGIDDYIDIPHEGAIKEIGVDYTISCWIRTSDDTRQTFATKKTGSNTTAFDMSITGFNGDIGNFAFELENGGGAFDTLDSGVYVADGNWHHVAGVRIGETGRAITYVDGVKTASANLDAGTTSRDTAICQLGSRLTDTLNRTDFYSGDLDDVRFYNRALSAPEIHELVYQQSPDNLIAYYPFDEGSGTTATDESIYGKDVTIDGATYVGSGQVGSDSLSFDGNNDLVDTEIVVSPGTDDAYSISAWFKAPAGGSRRAIAALSQSGGEIFRLEVNQPTSGDVEFGVRTASGSNATVANTTGVLDDAWHHAAAIFDGEADTIELYIDGLSVDSASFANGVITDRTLYVGADNNAGGTQLFFDGEIDDFRLYEKALTSDEVSDLASRTTTETIPALESSNITDRDTLESGLVGHWPLDEEAGDAIDHSVRENNGTVDGPTQSVAGKGGLTAYNFDGSDDYVDIDAGRDSQSVYTFTAWVNAETLSSEDTVISISNTQVLAYNFQSSNGFNSALFDGSSWNVATSGVSTTGEWLHLAYQYDGSTLRIFVDGVEQAFTSVGTPRDEDGDETIGARFISSGAGQSVFDGSICDVRIYNRALSELEINEIMEYSTPSKRPILDSSLVTKGGVARYSFDDADTDSGTLSDTFGSNDGTLNGGITTGVNGVETRSEAYTFDGTDSYISISGVELDSTNGGISTSVWVKPNFDTVNDSSEYSIIRGDLGGSNNFTIEYIGDAVWRFEWSSSSIDTTVNKNYQDEWLHIVASEDGSQNANMYFNGNAVLDDSFGSGQTVSGTIPVDIGRRGDASYWDGEIDELRIYDRKLEPFEVRELYASPTRSARVGVDDVSDGLVSRWSMDESDVSSSTITDSVGNNNGSIEGGVETGHIGVGYGQSFRLDGSDGQIRVSDDPSISGLSEITLSIWLNTDNIGGNQTFWTKGSDASNNISQEWFMRVEGTGEVRTQFSDGNNVFEVLTDSQISAGEWYHIVWSLDGDNARQYINGTLTGTVAMTSTINDDGRMIIGSQTDGGSETQYFNGFIDDARIYNRALSQYEIWKLYNLGRGYYWSEQ